MTKKLQLSELVDAAPALARELHSKTDELNDAIRELEDALARLGLGVSASITIEEAPHGDGGEFLDFRKVGRPPRWTLVQTVGWYDSDPDEWSVNPIVSLSREKRLQMVKQLPALVEAIRAAAEHEIERVNEAVAFTRDLSAQLANGGAS